ncbi:Tricalbin-2 [Nosema granulosis]|uniref:Tricalbin-2 n=1 Tax=Nosema granulosis TaxID=83296 RepID=A0A9P6H021_9MICR|nr:Tricalbin-2 [Nosema granulosis]
MKQNNEITEEDRKLSRPLGPLDVPVRTRVPLPEFYQQSITEFKDALDIDPKSGVFFYLRIPSIIFMATIGGYIVGRFNMSYMYILLIAYSIYFIYKRKINRFTNSLKSLINYDTRREKAKYNGETVEWMNYTIAKFWDVAEPKISSDIYQAVNRELLKVCPPFLNDLKLTEFTLGSRAPFVDKITYHSSKDDTVTLDVNVGFVPLEASKDAVDYFLGEKKKWNSKIVLTARMGTKTALGINLPILVKEFYFTGRLRAIMRLVPKNNFIKDVEICLMEVPDFNFTLVPLKTVDIMDVPGLSKWISNIIRKVLSTSIVNPNSIVVNIDKLAEAKGHNIGVVCLQVLNLENEEDERLMGEIDIDGTPRLQTSFREGRNLIYNEYFYMIVQNVDERIGLNFRGDSSSSRRRSGNLFLRNVHLEQIEEDEETDIKVNNQIVKIKPKKQLRPRRTVFTKARLIREEETYAYVNTNMIFFPIQKKKTNSAIVKMKIVGAEDILGLHSDIGEIYSTYCTVIVSPLNKDPSALPLDFIQNTSSATALVVSGVLKTEEGEVSNIYPGTASTSSKLMPPSPSTFNVFESKKVFNSNSPNFNEEFEFFSRDLSVDVVSICIMNDRNNEILGRVSVALNDILEGKPLKYKLKDAKRGRMELKFDLNYVDLKETEEDIIKFASIQKITVETVSENGVFYGVVETNTDIFSMDPFTSSLPIRKSIYVPVHANDTLLFKLFKETSNGDVFIGEEEILINPTDSPKKTALILNESISITLRVEGEALEDYNGDPNQKDTLKIVQVKFGQFYGLNEEVFVEFQSDGEVLKAAPFSRDKYISGVFTMLLGTEDLTAYIKNGDQGENRVLGSCIIPKRFVNEKVILNNHGLAVDLQVSIQSCEYRPPSTLKKGYLEVYIKNARNIRTSDKGKVDGYIKILINDNKVYRTKTIYNTSDPLFNESFVMQMNKLKDVFTLQVYDQASSSKNSLVCFVEFPLHNIAEGFSEHEFKLTDAKNFKQVGATIRLGFNFCKDASTLNIKKRNIIGDFFGF